MSLPRSFLDELRARSPLVQVVGQKVSWDIRKSKPDQGDMWASCPFHKDDSTSFHVDDRKGFYYCFGCHAKGDVFSFVRETKNVEFIEAVRILASEAGMPMPEDDPQTQIKADKRKQLSEVMGLAVQHFRQQLNSAAGAHARDFLQLHQLKKITQERFDIGFAPKEWQNLWDYLKGKNVADELILECGLAKPSSKGGKPYDTFRGRIMFPIRDTKGRCVAFSGQAVDAENDVKYLNSPKTELFDGSRILYNLEPASEPAKNGQILIVAFNCIDVIALVQSGFEAAIAPCSNKMSASQLRAIWQISNEPLIFLESNSAGLRTAYRILDLALPLLQPGKSIRFALTSDTKRQVGQNKIVGRAYLQELVDNAQPLLQFFWQRETEGREFNSPERKAGLDKALRQKIKQIQDPSIRAHFRQEIKELRWNLFRPHQTANGSDPCESGPGQQAVEMSERKLAYIICECSCGKVSELSAEKLAPFLGEDLTATNSLSLLPKLRCTECQRAPSYIFDDKKRLLFGPAKSK